MTLEEMSKQAEDLRVAIFRLCNEADDGDVIVNALLSCLTEVLAYYKFSPAESLKICHAYISALSSNDSQEVMSTYMSRILDSNKSSKR
jgi:hypothetical protein